MGPRRSRQALHGPAKDVPDAIFCGNDQIARGVADSLRERGIAVPDAVSIVGFDNWEIVAGATRPPLTSIDMNLKELGHEAGRRLIDLIAGKVLSGFMRLPCSLVVRESCGAGRSPAPLRSAESLRRAASGAPSPRHES